MFAVVQVIFDCLKVLLFTNAVVFLSSL